ncbi:hypothetical protein KA977_10840 [Candidatus Dependentiae bacterium]|nr:hypothetical protein [Candidatus Dependentiae bacterium]
MLFEVNTIEKNISPIMSNWYFTESELEKYLLPDNSEIPILNEKIIRYKYWLKI